ncbi:MAG: hypothetical protein JO103_02250 [Candidatus Eremiobacteraeota bacterium]|nr:hypothetical protein [Candidatus Eremiobacteraeota bacterium]
MTTRLYVAGGAVCAALALAACGGGGGSGSAAPPVVQSTATPTPTPVPTSAPTNAPLTQSFQITVPPAGASGSAHLRRPRFVSPNTGSIRIAMQSVNGQTVALAPTVAKLASGVSGCSTDSKNNLVCTVSALAAVGTDVYAVTTYASSDGSGSPLAATTVASAVTTSGGTSTITLSLGGVATTLAFSPAVLPLVADGGIHRFALTVGAADASGATIVGATAYQSPISLAIVNDPTHALSLSIASVSQPGQVVTVTYDASKGLSNGGIQALTSGVAPVTLAAAPLNVAPSPVLAYDDASGGVPVTLTQAGFTGTFTASVANAQDASVSVAGGPLGSGSGVATVVPKTTFDVTTLHVANGSYGYDVPLTVVPHNGAYAAFGNAHTLGSPIGLVEGPDGKLWTGDAQNGTIVSFDPATGNYNATVVDTNNNGPQGIAFDASGNIWFADKNAVGKFVPSTGAVTTYTAGLGSSAHVNAIAADISKTTMWFYDRATNNPPISVNRPSFIGKIDTASGTITEYPSGTAGPLQAAPAIIVGPDAAVWLADGVNGALGRIDPSSGAFTEYPVSTPQYPSQAPQVLVNGPDGNLWFTSMAPATGVAVFGAIAPSVKQIALYPAPSGGLFLAMTVGADHNIWYTLDPGSGFFTSSQSTFGVINPATRTSYQYPVGTLPEFAVPAGVVDRGDRTLWILDNAFGQIGKVAFR